MGNIDKTGTLVKYCHKKTPVPCYNSEWRNHGKTRGACVDCVRVERRAYEFDESIETRGRSSFCSRKVEWREWQTCWKCATKTHFRISPPKDELGAKNTLGKSLDQWSSECGHTETHNVGVGSQENSDCSAGTLEEHKGGEEGCVSKLLRHLASGLSQSNHYQTPHLLFSLHRSEPLLGSLT